MRDPEGYCHGRVQRLYRLGEVVPEVPLGGPSIVAAGRQVGRDDHDTER